MKRREYVEKILGDRLRNEPGREAVAFAPANIALCKYWGKRNTELNLPVTDSLSISLGHLGATTTLRAAKHDAVILNGKALSADSSFYQRAMRFIDLFRPQGFAIELETESNIPVAAGLASSASGFAALVLALNNFFRWGLTNREASLLARIGSGSACRSIEKGFVHWYAGEQEDGLDSFAERINVVWPEFCIGLLVLESGPKPIGSREAMNRTVNTASLYQSWPSQVKEDLAQIRQGIDDLDFERVVATAEENALAMHATMIASRPSVIYWTPSSLEQIHRIHHLRAEGLPLYLTVDAGPNIKLLYPQKAAKDVAELFPSLVEVRPFDT